MRVVVDLNVFVSAILATGASASLVQRATGGGADLIVCPRLLDELDEVLLRPKFARFITSEETDVLLVLLRDQAEMHSDPVAVTEFSRDRTTTT